MNQYYHQQFLWPSSTVCVEVPEPSKLLNLINPIHSKLIILNVGYSLVHPDDRFVKSIGREISYSKMKPETFRLKRIEYDNLENITITIETISLEEKGIKQLTFKALMGKNRLYFIGARIK